MEVGLKGSLKEGKKDRKSEMFRDSFVKIKAKQLITIPLMAEHKYLGIHQN